MLRSKTGSALVTSSDPIIISQNGSPKGQASPAQSLLTLPTVDPPTNSSNLEPEVTSVLNGESEHYDTILMIVKDPNLQVS